MTDDWEPIEPFDVDDGQLDGLALHEAFTLGYEFCLVCAELDTPAAIGRPVRVENKNRIQAAARRRNRNIELVYMHDDPSESWLWLRADTTEADDATN